MVASSKHSVSWLAHNLVGELALEVSHPGLELFVFVHELQDPSNALKRDTLGAKPLNLSELGNVLDRIAP